jgi:hypothetical protein
MPQPGKPDGDTGADLSNPATARYHRGQGRQQPAHSCERFALYSSSRQGEAALERDGQRCWYGRPGSTLDHSAGVMSRPAIWQAKRSMAARPVGQIVAVPM